MKKHIFLLIIIAAIPHHAAPMQNNDESQKHLAKLYSAAWTRFSYRREPFGSIKRELESGKANDPDTLRHMLKIGKEQYDEIARWWNSNHPGREMLSFDNCSMDDIEVHTSPNPTYSCYGTLNLRNGLIDHSKEIEKHEKIIEYYKSQTKRSLM